MEAPCNSASREETSNLPHLPSLVVTEILSRLPIRTLAGAAKCVCKSWLNLVSSDTHLAKLHRQRSATLTELLLRPAASTTLYFGNTQFFPYRIHLKLSLLSNLSGFDITSNNNTMKFANSCNGLLCFHSFDSDSSSALIINPITGEFVTAPMSTKWMKNIIPPSNYEVDEIFSYRLGFSEEENRFKLLQVMHRANSSKQFAEICTFEKGSKWRDIGDCPHPILRKGRSESVFLDHKLHYDLVSSGIACFDFDKEQFGVVPIPSQNYWASKCKSLFGVFRGCLFVSVLLHDASCHDIWVMKEYGVEDSWEKMFSLPYFGSGGMVPLKQLENGEILLLCESDIMISYDPVVRCGRVVRHCANDQLSELIVYSPNLLRLKDALAGYEACIHDAYAGRRIMAPSHQDGQEYSEEEVERESPKGSLKGQEYTEEVEKESPKGSLKGQEYIEEVENEEPQKGRLKVKSTLKKLNKNPQKCRLKVKNTLKKSNKKPKVRIRPYKKYLKCLIF